MKTLKRTNREGIDYYWDSIDNDGTYKLVVMSEMPSEIDYGEDEDGNMIFFELFGGPRIGIGDHIYDNNKKSYRKVERLYSIGQSYILETTEGDIHE